MNSQKSNTNKISELQTGYQLNFEVGVTKAKPFLKWAGGKGQLVQTLVDLFPEEMKTGQIKKYSEPFIGGGALFFYVAQNFQFIESFFISDFNQELVLAYETIKRNVESLIFLLSNLEKNYHGKEEEEQKTIFYETRNLFNTKLKNINFEKIDDTWVARTAEIIFLNRTCFNGLFRVNSKGEFNVPFGDYKNPKISDPDNLRAISRILENTEIIHGDFQESQRFIDSKTFVYFDPPYRPISKTASFTSYSKNDFDDAEQKRLAEYYRKLSEKGAKLMLSNSDPKNENPGDHFFEDLYKGFHIKRVDATRMINSDASKRGKIKELVVVNY
jgi:DNA adenine methylase